MKESCEFCRYLGTEDDGNYPELVKSWPRCDFNTSYGNLEGFPFKKDMECFRADIWHTEFADELGPLMSVYTENTPDPDKEKKLDDVWIRFHQKYSKMVF